MGQFNLTQQTENHGLSPWKESIKAQADTAIMGNAVRKSLLVAFLAVLMVCGFALTSTLHFGTVQASTEVTGVISLDTTWTEANSPYILTGPVLVNSSVTLTIEPGVTVYLNGHYLRVNGTLSARGTSANKISLIFNGSHPGYPLIDFTSESVNWSEINQSGSIIENAVISIAYDNPIPDDRSAVSIRNSSPKINNNTIITFGVSGPRHKIIYSYGAPIISNNSIITNLPGSYVTGVYVTTSSPVIFNNVITGGVWGIYSGGGAAVISNNTVTNCSVGIRGYRGEQVIFDNIIAANDIGIQLDSGGFEYEGSQTVEKNLIINNNIGVQIVSELPYDYAVPLIRNNTIIKNDIGVGISGDPNPLIMFNNIQGNNDYSVHLGLNWNERSSNINATYNWWGTTDIDAINQTVYDFKNDFNLGRVDFVPFLTEPNPAAIQDKTPPITLHDYDGAWHTSDFTITLTATDNESGVKETYYQINDGTEKAVNADGSPVITSEGANNTLEYWSVDNAGNVESSNMLISIKLDKTAPTGSITINVGAASTTSSSVTLTLSAADATSGVAQMRFSNDGVTWSSWEGASPTKVWTLTSGDETKTVYYQIRDNAGNTATYSDTIILDTTAPSGSIIINGGDASTTSTSVTLTLTSTDATSGVYQVRYSNDGVWNTESWETPASTKAWTLTAGDGTKTVYYQIQDNAELFSSTYSDTISLQLPSPSPSPSPTTSPTPSPASTSTPSPSPSEQTTETPGPQPKPFPTVLVIVSIASVAVFGIGLLVYFKKRKH